MGAVNRMFTRGIGLLSILLVVTWLIAGQGQNAAAKVDDSPVPVMEPRAFFPLVNVPPPPPRVKVVKFADDFDTDTITDITHAGDERLFITRRGGVIRIVYPDGSVEPWPVLDIRDQVSVENWEEGLLGLAFHPEFPDKPYFYIVYTTGRFWRLSRFTVSPGPPVVAADELVMIQIEKPAAPGGFSPVHNGGDVVFGPDGYLYVPLGDGGPDPYDVIGPGDPNNHSQNITTLFGSILRLDVDQKSGISPDCGDKGYTIPGDNPYLAVYGCGEIWATGLRNPWRISFDSLTGDMFISDVGEWLREELNFVPAGQGRGNNYGWHCYEGNVDYTTVWPEVAPNCKPAENYEFPFYQYDHSKGECAITGGFVYRGSEYPTLYGRYLFIDFCLGEFKTLARNASGDWKASDAGSTSFAIGTFGEDVNGELYAGSWSKKQDVILFKIVVDD